MEEDLQRGGGDRRFFPFGQLDDDLGLLRGKADVVGRGKADVADFEPAFRSGGSGGNVGDKLQLADLVKSIAQFEVGIKRERVVFPAGSGNGECGAEGSCDFLPVPVAENQSQFDRIGVPSPARKQEFVLGGHLCVDVRHEGRCGPRGIVVPFQIQKKTVPVGFELIVPAGRLLNQEPAVGDRRFRKHCAGNEQKCAEQR